MDIPNVLLGLTAAANLVVVWFVYNRDRTESTNRLFALFTFFIALWALVILFFRVVDNPGIALLLIKLSYIAALILGLCFYHFSIIFPTRVRTSVAHRLATYGTAAGVTLLLLLPGALAEAIVLEPWGKQVILGPIGWSIFAAAFLFFFVGGQVRLLLKIPSATGKVRTQLIVVTSTVIIVGLCGMFFNLLLPSPFIEDFQYIWTGPLFTLLFAVVTTYAIFRYKLFNARAAMSELLVFALVLVLLIRALLAGSSGEWWLDASILAAASVLGALLIASVDKDIRQRETIETQKDAIERASAEKSEFMSFASHEIRNPVTAIRGYASLMLEGSAGVLDEEARQTATKISALSEDVLALINDFLSKSKAELGQITYRPETFDLGKLAMDIAETMRPAVAKRGLVVRFNGEGTELPVHADMVKIKEVVRNIIDNAIKYTAAGSIAISFDRHGGLARVRVADTGMGISPENLPRLFAKFSRADSHGENLGGSGIGLYLAKIFVEAQGGTIRAESPGEGNGSTFIIELPLVQ
jgi:signal transduction histidine kinase